MIARKRASARRRAPVLFTDLSPEQQKQIITPQEVEEIFTKNEWVSLEEVSKVLMKVGKAPVRKTRKPKERRA